MERPALGIQSSPKRKGAALKVDTAQKLGKGEVGRQAWEVVLQGSEGSSDLNRDSSSAL